MTPLPQNMLFDQQDHELLRIVNDVLNRDKARKYLKKLFDPYLHPHGIKEMAASTELRIAYAVIHLLDSLDVGKAEDRLTALRSLVDEVLHTAESSLRKNTARVLLQIMKELVRAHGDYERQLELAHDFRTATSGKARIIRKQLRRYYLLEMPEEWNQVTFDDHVHDANTKGRKSPTHLIMDAWIKGIRSLTVIYYNYVTCEAASEIVEAAEIMDMRVRIGVEFSARFRDKYAQFIWGPRGFSDGQDFLAFLSKPQIVELMAEGRKVSEYQQRYVFAVLREFNAKHRLAMNAALGMNLEPVTEADFLAYVGTGQPSPLHLAELIHIRFAGLLELRFDELREQAPNATPEEQQRIRAFVEEVNALDSETILNRYLSPANNPSIPDPDVPHDGDDVPELLTLTPHTLLDLIHHLHSGYRMTLNLSNLTLQDVLELLYDSDGMITHLEIFNLKDYATGKTTENAEINALQMAINAGNVITLKRLIRNIIRQAEQSGGADTAERVETLTAILRDISTLTNYYKATPLKSRIGSDSTSRLSQLHGMGLAIKETLPPKAQKACDASYGPSRQLLPVTTCAYRRTTYIPCDSPNVMIRFLRSLRFLPGLRVLGHQRVEDWDVQIYSTRMESPGNIVTLGGVQEERENHFPPESQAARDTRRKGLWIYLNHGVKNGLKVLIGFIPAFATFVLTKDWWLLRFLGAFIWFGITGLRNILQSVLGGGGLRRSPLLRWRNYVSWERLADSLLYTGFSVPLLDYLIKSVLLDQVFGITTTTNPVLLYTVMALANGIYLSSHNAFRGLPKSVIFGNFFRSVLSIPIAIALNMALGGLLGALEIVGVNIILQKWAAVISKAASDCVAGVIEGLADRRKNMRMRLLDYEGKFAQLFGAYSQLELLFPETDVLDMLASPKAFIRKLDATARNLEKIIITNALDLMYFWMYQPRARNVLRKMLRSMSGEEIQILVRSQDILKRQREISKLFIYGMLGKNFSRALSFYLDRSEEYITAINRLAGQYTRDDESTE